MKVSFTLCAFLGLIFCSSSGHSQTNFNYTKDFNNILARTNDKNDTWFYDKLIQRFNEDDLTMTDQEVLALLIGFTDNKNYDPYGSLTEEREIYELNDVGKHKEGLERGLKFLEKNPLNVKTLIEVAWSYHKSDDEITADKYIARSRRIFKAMEYSSQGDQAIFALGPADGQLYITKYLSKKLGTTMGSGEDKDGNFLDFLEAVSKDGQTTQLSFVIEHAIHKVFPEGELEKLEKQIKKEEKKNKKRAKKSETISE